MHSRLMILLTLMFTVIGLGALADAPQAHYLDEHLSLIVQHNQGWGVMGINGAAHEATKAAEPLQIGTTPYKRGIGIHAPSQTLIELGGMYERFEAQVGVQKQQYDSASIRMSILADGKRIYQSKIMRNGDKPVALSLKVKGVQMMQILTDDAGDGLSCDMPVLCDARFITDPASLPISQRPQIEIGRFAQLMEWDGHRTEGAPNGRTQEFPADELYVGTPLKANSAGMVKLNPINGLGCVGLEWIERRKLSKMELPVPASSGIKLSQISVQHWVWETKHITGGGSRWQGTWEPFEGDLSLQDGRAVFVPTVNSTRLSTPGSLKIRWLINGVTDSALVGRPLAYSRTLFKPLTIQLRGSGSPTTIELYNCYLQKSPDALNVQWDRKAPLTLKLLVADSNYAPQDSSRLVLKWRDGGCGLGIDDMIKNKRIWAPEFSLEAGLAPLPAGAPTKRGSTILARIQKMPEQSFSQAIKHLTWPEQDAGPTLLSLAAGQHKILAERSGEFSLDWSPTMLAMTQGNIGRSYPWVVTPKLGTKAEFVSRTMLDGYLPSPQVTYHEGKVQYHQSSTVLPLGEAPQGSPAWYRDAVVFVAEYTAMNTGTEAADGSVQISGRVGSNLMAITSDGAVSTIALPNGYSAYLGCDQPGWKSTTEGGAYTASGKLQPGQSAKVWLALPSTSMTTQQLQAQLNLGTPADSLRKYWGSVEKSGAQIELPDPMLQHAIQANRIHCWMAARNEQKGKLVVPWIASTYYGPLESESHSVIRGMMAMGEGDFTQRGLQFFLNQVNDKGYLTTGYTLMGTGWHLWTLGEYASLFPVQEWVKQNAPTITRASQWIADQRLKTMHTNPDGSKVPEWGMMPPGVMADWEVYAPYYYLNGYYYAGLNAASKALASVGVPEAAKLNKDAQDLKECIMRSFNLIRQQAPVVPLADGRWVPMYPTHALCPGPVAALYPGFDVGRSWAYDVELGSHHMVPLGVMAATDAAVEPMLQHMEDTYFLNSGWNRYDEAGNRADWFNRGGYAKVQPYYSRHAEIYAMLDNRKAYIRTYFNNISSLLNKEDLSVWEHFFPGAFNKTHETGGFLHQSRMMMVTDFDDTLRLAPFIPSDWMKGDKPVVVKNLPTRFGVVSYELRPQQKPLRVDAIVQIPTGDLKPARVELCVPMGKIKAVTVNGQAWSHFDAKTGLIDLTGLSGRVELSVK